MVGSTPVILCAAVVGILAGCGQTQATSGSPSGIPEATPNMSGLNDCPASGGPTTGELTGLGATIGQFRQAHHQGPSHANWFGDLISGGPNDGLPELSARCSDRGVIVAVIQYLANSMTEAQVKASLPSLGMVPRDSQLQSIQPRKACEELFFKSQSIAADSLAKDPTGTFLVSLQSPDSIGHWDATKVEWLAYELNVSDLC